MNFPVKPVTRRYAFVAFIMVLLSIAILVKAVYIMTVEKDFWMAVSDRFVKENDGCASDAWQYFSCKRGSAGGFTPPEYKLYMDFMSWEKSRHAG